MASTVISGGGTTRLLSTTADLTLNKLTLTRADSTAETDGIPPGFGAALLAIGDNDAPIAVTLDDVLVSNNRAQAAPGTLAFNADLVIRNSSFEGNRSETYAGAVFVPEGDSVTIERSYFKANRSEVGTVLLWAGNARVDQSVFEGNVSTKAPDNDETIFAAVLAGLEGDLTLTRSLFVGNQLADGSVVSAFLSQFDISNNTITGNITTAGEWSAAVLTFGTGRVAFNTIRQNTGAAFGLIPYLVATPLTVSSNLIEGHPIDVGISEGIPPDAPPELLAMWIAMFDHNLLGTANGSGLSTPPTNGNLYGLPSLLAPLADNGAPAVGATGHQAVPRSFMPYAGSPALNAGNATGAPAGDQRGVARPIGAGYDIGAVEAPLDVPPPPPQPASAVTPVPTLSEWAPMRCPRPIGARGFGSPFAPRTRRLGRSERRLVVLSAMVGSVGDASLDVVAQLVEHQHVGVRIETPIDHHDDDLQVVQAER